MSKPIRMCIYCKQRLVQDSLIRLQFQENNLISYQGRGRSFYICRHCIALDIKQLIKSFKRASRSNLNEEKVAHNIKEILVNG